MLKNKEPKIMKKLLRATLLALMCSLLSAFYISKVQTAEVIPDEIQMSGTQPALHQGYIESANKQW